MALKDHSPMPKSPLSVTVLFAERAGGPAGADDDALLMFMLSARRWNVSVICGVRNCDTASMFSAASTSENSSIFCVTALKCALWRLAAWEVRSARHVETMSNSVFSTLAQLEELVSWCRPRGSISSACFTNQRHLRSSLSMSSSMVSKPSCSTNWPLSRLLLCRRCSFERVRSWNWRMMTLAARRSTVSWYCKTVSSAPTAYNCTAAAQAGDMPSRGPQAPSNPTLAHSCRGVATAKTRYCKHTVCTRSAKGPDEILAKAATAASTATIHSTVAPSSQYASETASAPGTPPWPKILRFLPGGDNVSKKQSISAQTETTAASLIGASCPRHQKGA
mmetsp:Transcript_32723/g.98947  ORF Transcript_32723/g.98947 Transcript_32723/m.98947 type:complete len:335 (-) Transcript_32723:355-1359(-)